MPVLFLDNQKNYTEKEKMMSPTWNKRNAYGKTERAHAAWMSIPKFKSEIQKEKREKRKLRKEKKRVPFRDYLEKKKKDTGGFRMILCNAWKQFNKFVFYFSYYYPLHHLLLFSSVFLSEDTIDDKGLAASAGWFVIKSETISKDGWNKIMIRCVYDVNAIDELLADVQHLIV